jgi:hypothetical protein
MDVHIVMQVYVKKDYNVVQLVVLMLTVVQNAHSVKADYVPVMEIVQITVTLILIVKQLQIVVTV